MALATTVLVACGEQQADTSSPGAEGAAPATPSAPGDTATGARDFEPRDPAIGGLQLKATGPHAGSWSFQDVNGSVGEHAGAGATTSFLQLEAHDEPVHFRMRLLDSDGEIESGRYTIGATDEGVDAAFENAGANYRSIGGATGTVDLTRVTDDRAVGTFDLSLEALDDTAGTKARVSGTFDMRVQR
jgi:hypothetical protein